MGNKIKISICLGSSCSGRNNRENLSEIRDYIKNHNLESMIELNIEYCLGKCSDGPVAIVNEIIYTNITTLKIVRLIEGHIGVDNH